MLFRFEEENKYLKKELNYQSFFLSQTSFYFILKRKDFPFFLIAKI